MNILQLRSKLEPSLLRRPGVTGVGNVGNTLRIYVEGTEIFPSKIDNFPVEVFKTGKIKALSLLSEYQQPEALSGAPWIVPKASVDPLRTRRHRPVPGGVSIAHPSVTAGTMGTSLRFLRLPYGLSNDHVLAAGSTFQNPRANIGDLIYQPGPIDGGGPEDAVGTLYWYQPIDELGLNLVDAALYEPYPGTLSDEILEIGVPKGVSTVVVGDIVQKSGRTSGLLSAEVIDVNATVRVDYGSFSADFQNQIITDMIGEPGDSGSAVLDMVGPNLVGLLFAGSEYVTTHNHIGNVLKLIRAPTPTPPVEYEIDVLMAAGGTTYPQPGSYRVAEGLKISFTAVSDVNYIFDHWNLDGIIVEANPINVKMDANHTLQAVFLFVFPWVNPATLEGSISNSKTGAPIEGASVICNGYAGITDAAGLYRISEIPPKLYKLNILEKNYETIEIDVDLPTSETFMLNMQLEPKQILIPVPVPFLAALNILFMSLLG